MNISEQVLQGNRLALSRLLSMVENSTPEGQNCLDELFTHTGKAYILGITGPSGSGKSTLVNRLALAALRQGQGSIFPDKKEAPAVAVLTVDPSSPFSGGALLGDRVRMRDLMNHPEIFIRSMATRGALGGLARAAGEMVLALEAGGFDIIMVETVGAGQSEVDIARLAHTTIVVEAPGLGDGIQAGKAGILEIADILVVNKSDKSGAETAARHLANMLEIGAESCAGGGIDKPISWKVPVLKTSALNDNGIDELFTKILMHHTYLHESREWNKREHTRINDLFERILHEKILAGWLKEHSETDLAMAIEEIQQRSISPRKAVDRFFLK